VRRIVTIVLALAVARVAHAYPQFQLSHDQTCTSCHISPAGGLLLGENGLSIAETTSTYGGAPEFLHGQVGGPAWLELGGDLRAGAGMTDSVGGVGGGAFPMQGDLDAAVHGRDLTLLATIGFQPGSSPSTFVRSTEHWLMWHPSDEDHGIYVRAGRFMPVYGLRFAEHTAYTRRYGQTPLYGETYGAAVEYVEPVWEVHVTGFVHDPLQDAIENGNGGAAYGELRFAKIASIGAEARHANSRDDTRTASGVTAKLWLDPVLLEAEGQVIHQTFMAGGGRNQLVSYLLASYSVHPGWLLDIGVGQYDEDLAVNNVDLECVDANLHWFTTSHWELLLTGRIQTIALGKGGPTSGFALLQFHYRL
jgi:hypothetical protein